MGRKLVGALAACALLTPAVAVASDFDHPASSDTSQQFPSALPPVGNVQRDDTPNDPDYDKAEAPENASTNLYDERFDLFGFPSKLTPLAIYADGPNAGKPMIAGFNAAGAWKIQRGDPDTVVAILDTGIKWDRSGLRLQVHLNKAELPLPQGAAKYDANNDGVFNVDDYASDARVNQAKPTGHDLIAAFSDGTDADSNGYVDDIAGWDFFDDDNDPTDASSYFAAANHGSGRANDAVEAGNDGDGGLGVCPKCQFVPLRIWDTFVADQTTFALGVIYAADNGVSVIEGADGGLYHSAFAEQASEYAYQKGAVQTYSGDDLNTGNHNYPANYSHTMLIQGTVGDTYGLGTDFGSDAANFLGTLGIPLGSNVPTKSLFRGAGTTQYGGHSSISMIGATGSENTGKAAGAAAMVVAAGKARATPVNLTPDETREILEQTAEDVTSANGVGVGVQDAAGPGWDPHFGWGRVNLGDAVQLAQKGALPPEAAIWSPDWFAPLTGANVPITGRARARSGSFHYKLEWGVGETPSTWTTAKEGDASGTVTDFGTIDMNAVRAALAGYVVPPDSGAPVFSATSPNPFSREWTVRLVVTQAGVPTPGIDRRVFDGIDDATLKPGFPKKTGAGGEAPIRYADLNGDDKPELIVPLEDGTVHAYDAVTGDDLPGFPVKTDLLLQAANHASAPGVAAVSAVAPPREPPRAITLGDLDGDGRPELITTAGRHIYVWETDGTRRPGFPVSIDPSFCRAADQSQELHHRKCGFLASAAIADIGGKAIVAPALDGHVYAVRPDGSSVPHFPVDLVDTGIAAPDRMYAESINSPAIGDLDGDGFDDVVVASNESYGAADPGSTDILSDVLANGAGGSSRLYAISGKTGAFLPGWPVKLNGAIQSTLPLIGPGHDAAIAKLGGQTRVIASTTGSAGIKTIGVDGSVAQTMQQSAYGATSDATDRAGSINLFESAVVGDVLGTGTPAIVKYGISLSQVVNLLLVGQNVPYNHLINAFDATTGVPLPAFPRVTDDYQFLSSSTIAKVGGTGVSNQVLAGNGLGMLHAYDGLTGLDAPGFPKITGGWLFAPAALSDDGRMAGITREGYLFQWTSSAPKCQPAGVWDAFRHDEHGSGNLDADGTPPGTPADVKLTPAAAGMWTLEFTSPGDDRFCGTPAKYTVSTGDIGTGVSAAGTKVTRTLALPDSGGLALGATDEVGNRGVPAVILFNRSSGAATPTPGPGVSPSPTPTPTSTVPAVTPTPSPGGGDNNTGCTGPRTVGRVRHRGVRRLRGRARRGTCARIKRVKVAVRLRIGARRCRAVKRSGALGHVTPCRRTGHFLRAHGKRRWRLRFRTPLAPGGYTVRVRVIDKAGHRSRARTRHFRIR